MHRRIYGSMKWQTAEFPVPLGVKALMSKPIDTITFQFRNPVTCLRGLLSGPLAAEKNNLAFRPEPSPFYDDYVHGERLGRVYANCLQIQMPLHASSISTGEAVRMNCVV
jgi:hypothetical protein